MNTATSVAAAGAGLRQRAARLVRHADLRAMAFVVAAVILAYAPAWARGQVFYEADTATYYAPFVDYAAERMRAGELPLWNPYVLGGYPQFADGETGVLHPLHLPFLVLGAPAALLVWGPLLRAIVTALAAYGFVRALRGSPAAAAVAGLSYSLGSFAVAQQHHLNIANSVPVLPAVLACWEMAFRAAHARRRMLWLLAGGMAFATELLAVHPQLVLITGMGVAVYAAFSLATGRWMRARTVRAATQAVAWTLAAAVVTVGVGAGLAAVQVLPLHELIHESVRGATLQARETGRFAILPLGALQLLLPGLFGLQDGFWAAWNPWETAMYAGVGPLILALAALRWPSRLVMTLAAAGFVFAVLAQGDVGPIGLYDALRKLPYFDRARAPGRYVMVTLLMIAALAGLGLDRLRNKPTPRLLVALTALVGGAWAALLGVHLWLTSSPSARAAVTAWADNLPEPAMAPPGRTRVDLLLAATDPWRAEHLVPVACGLAAIGAIVWTARRPGRRGAMPGVLAALAAVELGVFASRYHPSVPVAELLAPPAYAAAATESGTYPRTFIAPELPDGSNRLLSQRVAEASGYVSLTPQRVASAVAAWQQNPNRLARVLGVARRIDVPDAYRGGPAASPAEAYGPDPVRYSLSRPAVVLDDSSPPEDGIVPMPHAIAPRAVLLVLSMDGASEAVQGEVIGSVAWVADGEDVVEQPLRAGIEVAERTAFASARPRSPAHSLAPTAATLGVGLDSVYTFARLSAPGYARADELRFEVRRRSARVAIHGLAVVDTGGTVHQIWEFEWQRNGGPRSGFTWRRFRAGPRAFLAPQIVPVASPGEAEAALLEGGTGRPRPPLVEIDARARRLDPTLVDPRHPANGQPGTARLLVEAPERLVLATASPTTTMLVIRDTFYPGWTASIDGGPAPVFAADLVGRAMLLPAGEHRVEMRFAPDRLRLGSAISAGTLGGLIVVAVALWAWSPLAALARIRRLRRA
ncbi:MAG: hypothetical protein FJ029_05355 [Actinobacteria bacterium]|nr:hypothetical protein [Actinomycetota bacterium]